MLHNHSSFHVSFDPIKWKKFMNFDNLKVFYPQTKKLFTLSYQISVFSVLLGRNDLNTLTNDEKKKSPF